MIDIEKREQKEQEKKKTRQRMQVKVDPNNYEFIPAQKETDYYDNDVNQRVGIYVRVSTDDVGKPHHLNCKRNIMRISLQNIPTGRS